MSCAAALPPYLEDWGPEHVKQWRDLLPETDRKKFQEFFASLPPEVDGEDLASYDKEDIKAFFTTPAHGRAFAPELYARLQKLKGQGAPSFSTRKAYNCTANAGSGLPVQVPAAAPPGTFLLFLSFIFVPCWS